MDADRQGRGVVVTASVMIVAGQLLAIANDVILRQNDPPDLVLLAVLIVLAVFLLRRARWSRWVTVGLVAAGGLLYLASVVLLFATQRDPGLWAAVPALASLRQPVSVFIASPQRALLTASVLMSGLLDVVAVVMLAFTASARAYFARQRV